MPHYLISFPSSAMDHIEDDEWEALSESSRAVIREAKAAGVYVFAGGIDDGVPTVGISPDGTKGPGARSLDGGFCVLTLPNREAAEAWAQKIAIGCRCDQDLTEFHFDPES